VLVPRHYLISDKIGDTGALASSVEFLSIDTLIKGGPAAFPSDIHCIGIRVMANAGYVSAKGGAPVYHPSQP